MYYLLIRPLGGLERRVPVPAGRSSIGRLAGNAIVLDEYGVSGRHAEIEVSGAEVLLRDLSSTNGLFVNGRRVESARLHPGDRVLLGSVVAVLQEAVSDRIPILQDGSRPLWEVAGEGEVREVRPSLLERAYVPTAPASEGAPGASHDAEAPDPETVLRLLHEILVESSPGGADGLSRALGAVVRFLGASEGFVVGLRSAGGFDLLASAGGGGAPGPPVLPLGVLRQVADAGTEICIDVAERPGEGCIVAPLQMPGRAGGALYLRVPRDAMAAARERLGGVRASVALLALLVERSEARSELRRTRLALASGVEWPPHAEGFRSTSYELVSHSLAMREAVDRLDRFADQGAAIVLRGEAGVGKERAARRLHALSSRRRAPFLRVACGLAPEGEERASLFGPGGEAGAAGGRLDLAEGGTVYFDEVAALGRASQSALAETLRSGPRLRVVLGSRRSAEGLRADLDPALAELLAGTPAVEIPPLRERKDDVIPLAQALARSAAVAAHRRVLGLSMDACRALRDYAWPGNVLELRSVVDRAVLLARDAILDVELLPFDIAGGRIDLPGLDALGLAREKGWREAKLAFERVYFAEVLRSNDGNIVWSAKHSGIARKNFYRKLRQHGLLPK